MSQEKEARDLALREYDKFMEKYKEGVEAGNMKLMQHMLKLEADKIRTQSILDAIEKSEAGLNENVYGDSKMKLQMSEDEYNIDQGINKVDERVQERERAFIQMATRPISIGDPDKMDVYSFDHLSKTSNTIKIDKKDEVAKEKVDTVDLDKKYKENQGMGQLSSKADPKPLIEVDPKTGKKTYNGPKLRSRKVVDGKAWDETHPDFH